MCKFNLKNDGRRIDPCMKHLIELLNDMGFVTFSCCCGHGKYNMTIVGASEVQGGKEYYELLSMKTIPRKKKFYKKDKQGVYYIPEAINGKD